KRWRCAVAKMIEQFGWRQALEFGPQLQRLCRQLGKHRAFASRLNSRSTTTKRLARGAAQINSSTDQTSHAARESCGGRFLWRLCRTLHGLGLLVRGKSPTCPNAIGN